MFRFAAALQQNPLPLFQAGLCFAREVAYPDLDILFYLQLLDELEEMAHESFVPEMDEIERGEWLAELLFQEWGFKGNEAQYNDPRNSYLNELLDRRLGLPISLSVLYLEMARRFAIPASGVGLPGHFVVAVRAGDKRLLLDPFHRGRKLSLHDCAKLVSDTAGFTGVFQAEWLAPVPAETILFRMLNNLRLYYLQENQPRYTIAILDKMALLDPQNPILVRDRGIIHYQAGRLHQALSCLDEYARRAPNAPDVAWLKENLAREMDAWSRLN